MSKKEEPVAWMYDWKTPIGNNREIQHVFTSKNHLTTDLAHILNDVENIRPLYLAPSTRKPLSNEEIWQGFPQHLHVTTLAFKEGVKWSEKCHRIGVNNEQ